MTIQSIHVRPAPNEYADAITDLAHTRQRWSEVTKADLLPIYDLLMRDAPGDAWAALINHDDDRGEGGSALWTIRNALVASDSRFTLRAEQTIDRLRLNLSAYFDDRIRGDLQDVWAEHRVSDRREYEAADMRARVRDAV